MKTRVLVLVTVLSVCGSLPLMAQRRGGGPPAGPPNPFAGQPLAVEQGRATYNASCTVCHGLNGGAGEMGPALGLAGRRHALRSPKEIFDAIRNGIPATGMPPTPNLSDDDIWKVAAYIEALRGTAIDAPAPGNATLGEEIFWGKAGCGTCHMVGGQGGIVGPELTNIAGTRKTASILDALTNPRYRVESDGGAIPRSLVPPNTYQPVRVTTLDGRAIRGVLKNEDSFSVQLLGLEDNRLHLLDRSRIEQIEYENSRLMPTDYEQRLTKEELRNLMAFLTRLSSPDSTP